MSEQHGSVAVLSINDPARRNALSLETNDELIRAVEQCEADPDTCAVVITGSPPAFCAGADLSQLGESRSEGLEAIYAGFLRVANCTLPTIAAVNGPAVGAGMNLALACDLRLAGASARFDARFLTLGIHPGGGHTWMTRRVSGLQTTMATVVFGEILDCQEAERVGLVWRCTSDAELLDTAIAMASRAGRGGRELALRTKETIRSMTPTTDHRTAIGEELHVQLWSMEQPEFSERLETMRNNISRRSDRSESANHLRGPTEP